MLELPNITLLSKLYCFCIRPRIAVDFKCVLSIILCAPEAAQAVPVFCIFVHDVIVFRTRMYFPIVTHAVVNMLLYVHRSEVAYWGRWVGGGGAKE